MSLVAILVRHAAHEVVGTVLCGRSDVTGLSEEGRRQARWIAERVAREPVASLRCSPRQRARETAEPMAGALGLPVTLDDAFDEIDVGEWTGLAFADLAGRQDWQAWNDDRSTARAGAGESMEDVRTRCLEGLDRLAAAMPGAGVVVVSHAEPIRAVVLDALGLPASAWDRIAIDPGSVTVVLRRDGASRLLRLNESAPGAVP